MATFGLVLTIILIIVWLFLEGYTGLLIEESEKLWWANALRPMLEANYKLEQNYLKARISFWAEAQEYIRTVLILIIAFFLLSTG